MIRRCLDSQWDYISLQLSPSHLLVHLEVHPHGPLVPARSLLREASSAACVRRTSLSLLEPEMGGARERLRGLVGVFEASGARG